MLLHSIPNRWVKWVSVRPALWQSVEKTVEKNSQAQSEWNNQNLPGFAICHDPRARKISSTSSIHVVATHWQPRYPYGLKKSIKPDDWPYPNKYHGAIKIYWAWKLNHLSFRIALQFWQKNRHFGMKHVWGQQSQWIGEILHFCFSKSMMVISDIYIYNVYTYNIYIHYVCIWPLYMFNCLFI